MVELTEKQAVRRAWDRFGFGAGGERLARAQRAGFDSTITRLLNTTVLDVGASRSPAPVLTPLERPRKRSGQHPSKDVKKTWRQAVMAQQLELVSWWLDRMSTADQQGTERLTWFWHGHFATSNQKVKRAELMLNQNQTMRRLGMASFGPLAQAMIVDPAMLVWLDGNDNTATSPNENLSREFMELFSLGHGAFSEEDVREAARALTGWRLMDDAAVFRPGRHDDGDKTILGKSGDFDAKTFVSLVLSQPASSAFVVSRLWFRLVSTTSPSKATLARLSHAYGPGRNISAAVRAMAAEPVFRHASTSLVKQPVEWLVGLLRATDVRPGDLEDGERRRLVVLLRGMGQVPFLPPSVGGWPGAGAWLTTAAALSRVEVARLVTRHATFNADDRATSRRTRPELVARILGIDRLSPRTTDAISAVADQLPMALAVAACSPEYTVSS